MSLTVSGKATSVLSTRVCTEPPACASEVCVCDGLRPPCLLAPDRKAGSQTMSSFLRTFHESHVLVSANSKKPQWPREGLEMVNLRWEAYRTAFIPHDLDIAPGSAYLAQKKCHTFLGRVSFLR